MGKPALITLDGADGIRRILSGPGMGDRGVELATSPAGFYNTPTEAIYTEHAFERGSTYNGMRITSMQPVFSVNIFGSPGQSWEEADDEWSTALAINQDATLWYEGDSSRRRLTIRLMQEMQFTPVNDPRLGQYGKVTMTCIAPDPFWYETSEFDKWTSEIDTTNGTTAYGSVTVQNPTPYPTWVKWRLQAGPNPGTKWTLPDFSWGNKIHRRAVEDADRVIHMPELLGNEHVDIETDENSKRPQVVSPLDTQIYMRMEGKTFMYPIAPRTPPTEVPVAVTGAPAGVGLRVECPLPWPKPWGMRR
ncbi:phage tail protein [Rhodococcus pyridinivorans]|uniref:phage tail protein n=1 Tax=Rhodococcus pyridinivorans TaxID=103816 RepID=UPI003AAB0C8A